MGETVITDAGANTDQRIDGDGDGDGGVSKSSHNATGSASDTDSISEISTHDDTNFGENSTLVRTQKGRPCVRDNVCLCDAKISWGEPEDCCSGTYHYTLACIGADNNYRCGCAGGSCHHVPKGTSIRRRR